MPIILPGPTPETLTLLVSYTRDQKAVVDRAISRRVPLTLTFKDGNQTVRVPVVKVI